MAEAAIDEAENHHVRVTNRAFDHDGDEDCPEYDDKSRLRGNCGDDVVKKASGPLWLPGGAFLSRCCTSGMISVRLMPSNREERSARPAMMGTNQRCPRVKVNNRRISRNSRPVRASRARTAAGIIFPLRRNRLNGPTSECPTGRAGAVGQVSWDAEPDAIPPSTWFLHCSSHARRG